MWSSKEAKLDLKLKLSLAIVEVSLRFHFTEKTVNFASQQLEESTQVILEFFNSDIV